MIPDINIDVAFKIFDEVKLKYYELMSIGNSLQSNNAVDNLLIKYSMAGFLNYAELSNWTYDHYKYIYGRLQESENWDSERGHIMRAMCLGSLCGMVYNKMISEKEFQLADMQIPGIFALNIE